LFIDCPTIGTWFLNNRNLKLFLTNTNVTSRSLNTSWSKFIEQLVNTLVKWYRKSGIISVSCLVLRPFSKGRYQVLYPLKIVIGTSNFQSMLYKIFMKIFVKMYHGQNQTWPIICITSDLFKNKIDIKHISIYHLEKKCF
jgi:hypothetical protein